MRISSTNFCGNNKKKDGFFVTTLKSVGKVCVVAATGSTIGAAGGRIASLIPYTPSEQDIKMQVQDLFSKAVQSEGKSPLIKGKEQLELVLNDGIKFFKQFTNVAENADVAQKLYSNVAKTTDEVINNEKLHNTIKEFFKENLPLGSYKKENVLSKLKDMLTSAVEESDTIRSNFNGIQEKFVGLATKNDEILEVAKKGAKHLRTTSFVGIGVAIGLLGALILNMVQPDIKFGKNKQKTTQAN